MADVKLQPVEITTPTSTGNFNVTASGFGTPSAVLVFCNLIVSNDTSADTAALSVGVSDGTNDRCCAIRSGNNALQSEAKRYDSDADVLAIITNTTTFMLATVASFSNDTVTLNFTKVSLTSQYKVTVVFIGGADVADVYAGTCKLDNTTNVVNHTAPGFEPSCLLTFGTGFLEASESVEDSSLLSFGAVLNDASTTQKVILYGEANNDDPTDLGSGVYSKAQGQAALGAVQYTVEISDFDASGFSYQASVANTDSFYYLALRFTNDPPVALFDVTIPTTGNYAETAAGFEPVFGLISLIGGPSSRDTPHAGDVLWTIAAFDDSTIRSHSFSVADNVSTTDTQRRTSTDFSVADYSGGLEFQAARPVFDADGWDATVTTNPGSSILGWGLAIGTTAGGTIIDAMPAVINATTVTASVVIGTTLNSQIQSINLVTQISDVFIGRTISVPVQEIKLDTRQSSISAATLLSVFATPIVLAPREAELITGPVIRPEAGHIDIAPLSGGITAAVTINADPSNVSVEALASIIGVGSSVFANAESIEIDGRSVAITLSSGINVREAQITLMALDALVTGTVAPLTAAGLEFTLPINRVHFFFNDEDD
jgi:hypothetical protein